MNVAVKVNAEEAGFLMVLLCEEEVILKRMKEMEYPMDEVDLRILADKFRQASWEHHWANQRENQK